MLRHYYNILEADKFEKWYGDLYIGKHPTPERNSYLIIYLNFAVVNAELNSYRQSLDAHCNTEFNFFCDVYAQYLPEGIKEEMNKKKGAVEQLDYLYKECTGYRLKKILENLRSLGVISFSRGPEGIHLEKSGQNLIKTHEIS